MSPVTVIGHRHPDLDSVAAAISYAALKKNLGETGYSAAVAGEMNRESRYVLDKLNIPHPPVVSNVRARVEDLLDPGSGVTVLPSATLREVAHLVQYHDQKTLPVTDASQRLLGLVTIGDVAATFMERLGGTVEAGEAKALIDSVMETRVSSIMKTGNLLMFERQDAVEEARSTMLKSRFRNYPVIDEDNRLLGMISRYHLLRMKRKQLVLVDHNEKSQAVEGIEEAEILEVIDHHRVGDIQSVNPIYFRNEPVGATSTLIALMFRERGQIPAATIASLMLAGIVSDTMIFRSPTTTSRDREMANWLSGLSGLDMEKWGREIFKVASPSTGVEPARLIADDLKEYTFGETRFAVAQIETADLPVLLEQTAAFRQAMDELAAQQGYELLFLMITDIFVGGSQLLVAGGKQAAGAAMFGAPDSAEIFLNGIMSRKKQVIPSIFQALARQEMGF